jgi:hypothetical protein
MKVTELVMKLEDAIASIELGRGLEIHDKTSLLELRDDLKKLLYVSEFNQAMNKLSRDR